MSTVAPPDEPGSLWWPNSSDAAGGERSDPPTRHGSATRAAPGQPATRSHPDLSEAAWADVPEPTPSQEADRQGADRQGADRRRAGHVGTGRLGRLRDIDIGHAPRSPRHLTGRRLDDDASWAPETTGTYPAEDASAAGVNGGALTEDHSCDTPATDSALVGVSFVGTARRPSRLRAALRDRLPVALRGRWHVDRRAAAAAGLLALAAVLVACWQLWQAQPRTDAFSASDAAHATDDAGGRRGWRSDASGGGGGSRDPSGDRSGTTPDGVEQAQTGVPDADPGADAAGGTAGTGTPDGVASPGTVEVDVVGKVRAAGVVRLPTGSRVADAVAAAGGALPGTDLNSIDLAQPVSDGEQIRVGLPPAPGTPVVQGGDAAPGAAAEAPPSGHGKALLPPGTRISLSTATPAQLEELPDIGPAMAARIVAWRTAHGGFDSVGQLQQVPGIGPAKFARLEPLVSP